MKHFANTTGIAVLASLALAACSAEDPPLPPPGGGTGGSADSRSRFTYHDDVVPADRAFIEAVEVRPDSLVLPRTGFEAWIGRLGYDRVVFGEWAAGHPARNPTGFLRRVDAVREEGDRIVVDTHPATLDDLFAEADIYIDTTEGTAAPSPTGVGPLNGPAAASGPLAVNQRYTFGFDTGGSSVGTPQAGITRQAQGAITLDFNLGPTVMGNWKKDWNLWNNQIDFDIGFPFESSATVCASIQTTAAFNMAGDSRTYRSPVVAIGTPLALTGSLTMTASCFPFGSGSSQVESTSTVYGRPSVKFGYNGDWYSNDTSEYGSSTRTTTIVEGTLGLRCEVQMGLEIRSYESLAASINYVPSVDAPRITGTGRRTVELDSNSRSEPTRSTHDYGEVCLETAINHRADVELAAYFFDKKLLSYNQTIWNGEEIPGSSFCAAGTCRANDEVGVLYCAPGTQHAYICAAGSGGPAFNGNDHCPSAQYCQPTSPTDWRAKLGADGKPLCEANRSEGPSHEPLSCVSSAGWAGSTR